MGIFQELVPILETAGLTLAVSFGIYIAIRFFAYKRSFPLPHKFDFLWIVATLLVLYLLCAVHPPLAGTASPRIISWTTFATFLLICYIGIFVLDQFFVEYFMVTVLKLYVAPPLRKAIVMFVFLIGVIVGMQKIFNMNPIAVYSSTGAITLGIGLALKDAFQMFFAGLALSRVIRIGDWINLGDKEGVVVDINWAKTVLRTWEGTHLFIPNNDLQKGIFFNYSYGDPRQRCRLEISASYDVPPQKVKGVLQACVVNVEGVLNAPHPEVLLTSYGEFSVHYALTFWISDYSRHREISSEAATRIWYAFKRENIEIPFPIRTVHMAEAKTEAKSVESESLLTGIDLFRMLSSEEKQMVLERLLRQVYLKGEVAVREGDPGSSFFIVHKGQFEVLKQAKDGSQSVIGNLGQGQFFGELSLLTGEARSATVRAVTDSELLRLDKADFKGILEKHPQLAEEFANIVGSRQAVLVEHSVKQEAASKNENKNSISSKIRDFFNLKVRI